MNTSIFSTVVRAGKTNYFIDVDEGMTGKKYITIKETRMISATGVGEEKKLTVIQVFDESIEQFKRAIVEAAAVAKE